MSAPTYFRDAADYHDWWFFSGTALGGSSAGETFRMFHNQLSEAGAHTLIAARFLDENDQGIDPQLWRRAFVFGQVGNQVSLTLRALEAIGAGGVAGALRSTPAPPSLVSRAQEVLKSGDYDSPRISAMIQEARENVAVGLSHVLGEVPEELQATIPQARTPAGVETREEFQRLLDAYVAAHQDDLARDVARYGDPRQAPGFDAEAAREERARRIARLNFLKYQRGKIDDLREHLQKLRDLAGTDPPESPRLNKALRKVLGEYAEFADRPPENLMDELKDWLRAVERFRDEHAAVLQPKATQNEGVAARLAALGAYEVSYERETPSLAWVKPAGLPCPWADIGLHFSIVLAKRPDPAEVASALDALCDEAERFQARWDTLLPELERFIIERFHAIADQLPDENRALCENDDGEISDKKILEAVEGGSLALTRHFNQPVHAEFSFAVPWDEEHGIEVPLDEAGNPLRYF